MKIIKKKNQKSKIIYQYYTNKNDLTEYITQIIVAKLRKKSNKSHSLSKIMKDFLEYNKYNNVECDFREINFT